MVPKDVGGLLNPEGIVDPVHETFGTGTAELGLKLILADVATVLCGVVAQVVGGTDFIWPHNLVVVDEEDRHLGNVQQFLNLRLGAALVFLCVLVVAAFANPVRLVADKHVNFIGPGLGVAVEVFELHRAARTDDPAQGLCKGL